MSNLSLNFILNEFRRLLTLNILGPSPLKFADTLTILVENGEIPVHQLKTSVRRILELKAKLGLHKNAKVNLDQINTIVGHRDHQRLADSAASLSIVLLRDHYKHVPVNMSQTTKILSISYDRDNTFSEILSPGNAFNRMLQQHIKTVDVSKISPESSPSVYQHLIQKSADVDQVIISIYLRPELGSRVQDKISEPLVRFINHLQAEEKQLIVVSFGELEVLSYLPDLRTFMFAWSGQDVMQRAAAKALLGITPIAGHLPINLLPYHKRGEGLHSVQ